MSRPNWAPVDSTDAKERRELEEATAAAAAAADAEHSETCCDGWLGEDQDGRPVACPRCRPHLVSVPCWKCSQTAPACSKKRASLLGACCEYCDHHSAVRP